MGLFLFCGLRFATYALLEHIEFVCMYCIYDDTSAHTHSQYPYTMLKRMICTEERAVEVVCYCYIQVTTPVCIGCLNKAHI